MYTGWRYRGVGVTGTAVIAAAAVLVANHSLSQTIFTSYVPLFWRLEPTVLAGEPLWLSVGLAVVAVVGALLPLYKPQPRRRLAVVALAHKRVVVAMLGLATLGYFKWSLRLPRATLTMTFLLLCVAIPAWFLWLHRPPPSESSRAVIVGDDLEQIRRIADGSERSFLGCLCPSSHALSEAGSGDRAVVASDGGNPPIERLGGLSRIEDVLVEYDVDTAVLAFHHADRGEFFGALDACYDHGVAAKVHREYSDAVLTNAEAVGTFVDVDIEPWDVQDHMLKRGFDVLFSGAALLALSPAIVLIALAIKLEGNGPVLFSQERTYLFGETFTVQKFRTLRPEPGGEVGTSFDGDRETSLGNFLRTTHLDEIPQLWSILVGDMSVVGPRPAQTALEGEFQAEATEWRQRWFVKPGLTGLAQINDATSSEPREKIQYDLQYIRTQSFWLDVQIVVRQLWLVVRDVASLGAR